MPLRGLTIAQGAQLGGPPHRTIAKLRPDHLDRLGKVTRLQRLAEPELPRPLLKVRHANPDEPHRTAAILFPRALEQLHPGAVDLIGDLHLSRHRPRPRQRLERREPELQRHRPGRLPLRCKIGRDALGLGA